MLNNDKLRHSHNIGNLIPWKKQNTLTIEDKKLAEAANGNTGCELIGVVTCFLHTERREQKNGRARKKSLSYGEKNFRRSTCVVCPGSLYPSTFHILVRLSLCGL